MLCLKYIHEIWKQSIPPIIQAVLRPTWDMLDLMITEHN